MGIARAALAAAGADLLASVVTVALLFLPVDQGAYGAIGIGAVVWGIVAIATGILGIVSLALSTRKGSGAVALAAGVLINPIIGFFLFIGFARVAFG